MKEDQVEPTVTFTLSQLRVFKFGDERLDTIRPVSLGVGDTAKVFVIPLPFGQLLSEVDKQEDYFHVELFPTHAELWLSFEWKESNVRRSRSQAYSATERTEREKRNERIVALKASMPALPEGKAEFFAKMFLDNLANTDQYSKVLEALNILDKIDEYARQDGVKKGV